jgi:hypothetical protein
MIADPSKHDSAILAARMSGRLTTLGDEAHTHSSVVVLHVFGIFVQLTDRGQIDATMCPDGATAVGHQNQYSRADRGGLGGGLL